MRQKRTFSAPTATAAVLAVLVLSQTPASAHYAVTRHGKDTVRTWSDHHTVEICDGEKDGHWVYGKWFFEDGSSYYTYDTSGADGKCTRLTVRGRGLQADDLRGGQAQMLLELHLIAQISGTGPARTTTVLPGSVRIHAPLYGRPTPRPPGS